MTKQRKPSYDPGPFSPVDIKAMKKTMRNPDGTHATEEQRAQLKRIQAAMAGKYANQAKGKGAKPKGKGKKPPKKP